MSFWEEELLREVSARVLKVSDIESTHRCDSREEPCGGGTSGAHDSCDY